MATENQGVRPEASSQAVSCALLPSRCISANNVPCLYKNGDILSEHLIMETTESLDVLPYAIFQEREISPLAEHGSQSALVYDPKIQHLDPIQYRQSPTLSPAGQMSFRLRHTDLFRHDQSQSHCDRENEESKKYEIECMFRHGWPGRNIPARHPRLYELPRQVRLWRDDFSAARFAIACLWRQSKSSRQLSNGGAHRRQVIEFVSKLLEIFDGNIQLQFAFRNWVRHQIRSSSQMKSGARPRLQSRAGQLLLPTCSPPQSSSSSLVPFSPLRLLTATGATVEDDEDDVSTRPVQLIARITRAVALNMRESFVHATLKLAQRAFSTRSNGQASSSTKAKKKPAAPGPRKLTLVVNDVQDSKKRKRDDANSLEVDVQQEDLVDAEDELLDVKSKKVKKIKGNAKIDIACEYCRGRKIKCGGEKPQCARCKLDGRECVFADTIRRRGLGKATLARRRLQDSQSQGSPVSEIRSTPFDVTRSPSPSPVTVSTLLVSHQEVATPLSNIPIGTSQVNSIPTAFHYAPVYDSSTLPTTLASDELLLSTVPSDVIAINTLVGSPPPPLPATMYFVDGVPVGQLPLELASRILEEPKHDDSVPPVGETDEEMDDWEPTNSESLSWLSLTAPEVTKESIISSPTAPPVDSTGLGCFDTLDPAYSSGYLPSDGILNRSACVSPYLSGEQGGPVEEDDMFMMFGNNHEADDGFFAGGMMMMMEM